MPRGEFDRSARKAETRARLLEAAATVYARSGFSGATLDQVAAEAGFTKGAVYAHFGSKENLLLALLEEHLTSQIAEQMALFDRERVTWERPLAGSAHWMERLEQDPDRFRLLIELWIYAQRDERLRERLAAGMNAMREMFIRFATDSAADAGLDPGPHAAEQFATATLGLSIGLPMLKLLDRDSVSPSLRGTVLSILIRTAELNPELLALLGDPAGTGAVEGP
jgi:AcrR family transcriptional regulator